MDAASTPNDLSQQLEKSFDDRLVKRDSAQQAGVAVRQWSEPEPSAAR